MTVNVRDKEIMKCGEAAYLWHYDSTRVSWVGMLYWPVDTWAYITRP